MGRVLISEPHEDISGLLTHVVRRIGQEPVAWTGDESVLPVDVAVIEPGEENGLRLATLLVEQGVPIIFTSIFSPTEATLRLKPAAYLVKPFPLFTLECALNAVLGVPFAEAS